MSVKGGQVETYGFHTSRIKILSSDWVADDDSLTYGVAVDELNSTGSIQIGTGSLEVYAFKSIPYGYKATECRINCSSDIQVRVWHCDINGTTGTEISNTGSTQYTNAVLSLTSTASTDDNFIMVFVFTTATTHLIKGGYITIERI